jgi:hypothetical protein
MSQTAEASGQFFLFEVDQQRRADGSFVVAPRKVVIGQEISAKRAASILGFKDPESIYRLIDLGEIAAWKPKAKRGNAKWRIDWRSVMDYKERRKAEAAGK